MDGVRLPAVERTLDVIELLSVSSHGLTLSEICRTIGIPKSSGHYLIQTLLARGFLYRNLDGCTYSIGSRLPGAVVGPSIAHDLQNGLAQDLQELARISGLAGIVTVLKEGRTVVIVKRNPPSTQPAGKKGSWVGIQNAAHCTAQGKVHLAYLTELELDGFLKENLLLGFTPKTICSTKSLRMHLARVRLEGFAVNDQEHIIGVRDVAAPIFNHVGCAIAAIGVTGSVKEMPYDQIPAIAKRVISVANEASRKFLDRFRPNTRLPLVITTAD